jgi:exonuclease SbcC
MTELPLRSLTVSEFRTLRGTRVIPLDAPIVLMHGPNGTGKTSVLSALEMALTGRIGSMERQDERYTAHLPTSGQKFATLQVEIAPHLRANQMERMTIGGARVEGEPALDGEVARFFSERCYLDQSSLGRLLELYQLRDGKQESLLARFVNEILGLENLDALRSGLHDANDLRSLKKLSSGLAAADEAAKRAAEEVTRASARRDAAALDLDAATANAAEILAAAGVHVEDSSDLDVLLRLLEASAPANLGEVRPVLDLDRELAALGGRIEAAAERPSARRLADARDSLEQAREAQSQWKQYRQPSFLAWAIEAEAAGVGMQSGWVTGMADALALNVGTIAEQTSLRRELASLTESLADSRGELAKVEDRLLTARAEATTLVEGLAAVRTVLRNDICPVCDRDYAQLENGHLDDHLDRKIARLAEQGATLVELRRRRDDLAADVDRDERGAASLAARMLADEAFSMLEEKRSQLEHLDIRLADLAPVIDEGISANAEVRDLELLVEELETSDREHDYIDREIARLAELLGTTIGARETASTARKRLTAISAEAIADFRRQEAARLDLAEASRRIRGAREVHGAITIEVADAVRQRTLWDGRVTEAKRRQRVARDVHDAAAEARTTIVQSVFTKSLNHVWAELFKRLAPHEEYVPSFGIPSTTKTALEVVLETRLPDGSLGGPPQLMLSAGNLNTAALSLFLALHLAVEPSIRCLVFDDPVQAMDEVHVSQFAALIRTLSKQHERQVVIAVHERELFDYLSLELSPAYPGDSLITVELGERASDPDEGITRRYFVDDQAITG